MPIKEGQAAPAFTLADSEGRKVSLKDFRGRDVVVYFYPRDNTSGCTKEAQSFQHLLGAFDAEGVAVVGISPDNTESHTRFRSKFDLSFPLLSDPEKKVMKQYGAYGEKMMYGKKVTGVIRSTVWIGANGKVRKHWPRVAKAADHPAAVLAAVQAAPD